MKHCPSCNRSFPDDAPPFCNEDGARLVSDSPTPPPPAPPPPPVPPPAAPATKHCPTCKRSFPADAPPFCNDDGARLVSDIPASSPPLPSPPPAPTLASVPAPLPPPAQAPSAPAKKTVARRVLIVVVAVIAIILGVIQIMRGLHLISYKPKPAEKSWEKKVNDELGERVYLANHGCSLRPPKSWERKDAGGGGTMFSAPSSSGSPANIIITTEPYAGSLSQYQDATIKAVKAVDPTAQMTFDIRGNITFASYVCGIVTFRRKIKDLDIEQNLYFFDGLAGQKIVITTSTSAAQAQELKPRIDKSVQSLTTSS